jgi:teichuronic acid biosynthesis glycosyltransferase TuaG
MDSESSGLNSGLVSIITPVFNSERFIEETIDSVLGQTCVNWELILVDDCSTDQTPELIKNYIQMDKRIRYIRLERNMGAAAARNRGLEAASGRYVAFIDADDLWMPDKLIKQLTLMKEKNVGFTFTAIEMIDENDNIVKAKRAVVPVIDYKFLLSNTMIACSSVVLDREMTGKFQMPDVRKGQDFATWLMLLRGGLLAYGIDRTLVRYRLVNGSISSNKFGALKRTWKIYREQEHLNIPRSAYYFSLYALHALKKYHF